MRAALEKLMRKIEVNKIGERTDYKDGYGQGLADALDIIEDGIAELMVSGNNYYVIMYENGDTHYPYIEEMRLFRVVHKSASRYYFSRNLKANYLQTNPDLVLYTKKAVFKRVFFTKEEAEKAIHK